MKRIALLALCIMTFVMPVFAESMVATEQQNLTIENCADFAALCGLINEFDPSVAAFAEKYDGMTLEFDGNIAYISNHGNYQTRYDVLIYAGDYSETTGRGPSFQFQDVGVLDLGLSGLWLPDFVVAGANIHIIAKVGKYGSAYNEKTGLFELDPILIEQREASEASEAIDTVITPEVTEIARWGKVVTETSGTTVIIGNIFTYDTLLCHGFMPSKAEELVRRQENGEPLTDFHAAEYNKYNSPAEENGLKGDTLVLAGKITKYVHDGTKKRYSIGFQLMQSDGMEWMVLCGYNDHGDTLGISTEASMQGKTGVTVFDNLEEREVLVYCKYMGFSEKYHLPAVNIATYGGLVLMEEEPIMMMTSVAAKQMDFDGIADLPYVLGVQRENVSWDNFSRWLSWEPK